MNPNKKRLRAIHSSVLFSVAVSAG
jgi:hypothetical protein